jgi:hypothetical protein
MVPSTLGSAPLMHGGIGISRGSGTKCFAFQLSLSLMICQRLLRS